MNKLAESIFDHSFEYARNLLEETKEFYPFGAFTDTKGQVHPLEFDVEKNNIPNNGKVIEVLEKYCKDELESGNITAYGLVYEVQLKLKEGESAVDAIALDIQQAEESLPLYYQPFSFENNKVKFDSVFAVNR